MLTVLALLIALAGCGAGDTGGAGATSTTAPRGVDPAAALAGAELVEALRGGGHVIFFRHAATDRRGQPDDDLTTCATQRNLNAQGRDDARAIGAAFRERAIPVGLVLTSRYCRTRDTARLAFGRVDAQRAGIDSGASRVPAALSVPPAPGTNTVVVGHLMPATALRLPVLDEGGAAVLLPADGDFTVRATLAPGDWAPLPR